MEDRILLLGQTPKSMEIEFVHEQELLQSAKRFEQNALTKIYDSYSPGIYAYSMRLLGDTDLAEECVAETFDRFLKALRMQGGPQTYLQAYLYRIAHNWITDHYRRQPPLSLDENIQVNSEDTPAYQVDIRLQQMQLRAALQQLTSDQQQVIVLRYLEGWDHQQIANALAKPVGAIKALQHRAITTLRKLLVAEEGDQDDQSNASN